MTGRGRLTAAAVITEQAAVTLRASGSMTASAAAGRPPRLILIGPGAAESPEDITEEGSWQQRAPHAGPSQVTVSEVEDGQFSGEPES